MRRLRPHGRRSCRAGPASCARARRRNRGAGMTAGRCAATPHRRGRRRRGPARRPRRRRKNSSPANSGFACAGLPACEVSRASRPRAPASYSDDPAGDELAAAAAHEAIDAHRAARQHAVAGRRQLGLVEVVPTGMAHLQHAAGAGEQRMVAHRGHREDAGALRRQRPTRDAVEVQHGGMGGEARPDRRARAGAGPIDHLSELRPECLVAQVGGARLGAVTNSPSSRPPSSASRPK